VHSFLLVRFRGGGKGRGEFAQTGSKEEQNKEAERQRLPKEDKRRTGSRDFKEDVLYSTVEEEENHCQEQDGSVRRKGG